MALVKFGAAVNQVSGKIGGVVFLRGKGGNVMRSWRKGVNPQTPAQTAQRERLAWLSNAWKGLTASQRKAWDTSAEENFRQHKNRLGEVTQLTGHQLFLKVNLIYQVLEPGSIFAAPAAPVVYPEIIKVSRTFDNTLQTLTMVFNIPTAIDPSEFAYVLRVGGATPVGRKAGGLRIIKAYRDGDTELVIVGQQVTLTVPYAEIEAIVGEIIPDMKNATSVAPLSEDDPWNTIKDANTDPWATIEN